MASISSLVVTSQRRVQPAALAAERTAVYQSGSDALVLLQAVEGDDLARGMLDVVCNTPVMRFPASATKPDSTVVSMAQPREMEGGQCHSSFRMAFTAARCCMVIGCMFILKSPPVRRHRDNSTKAAPSRMPPSNAVLAAYFSMLKRFLKRSTRPPVSTSF